MSEIEALQIPVDAKIRAAHPHFAQDFHSNRRRMFESLRRCFCVHIGSEGLCRGRGITLCVSTISLEYADFFVAREPCTQGPPVDAFGCGESLRSTQRALEPVPASTRPRSRCG